MGMAELVLVRHGESMGNLAASAAEATGAEVIDVGLRDADVPLSATGVEQARALGSRLGGLPPDQAPEVVWSSPYRRAVETTMIALETAQLDVVVKIDERLRDRELGVLDLLTRTGVAARFPEEAARRQWLGKFYHRPPGGESWADVALRARSAVAELDQRASGNRVLVVSHDAMVVVMRYICENLTEAQLLELTATTSILNGSISRLVRLDPDPWAPWAIAAFNDVAHLENLGVPVTQHSGDPHVKPQ
jgi:broad specificity phosphatase PhoE